MPWIRNVSREAAEAFRPFAEEDAPVACLSISQPSYPARLNGGFQAVLCLEFSDWDLDRYTREAALGNPANCAFFTEEQAEQIAGFLRLVVKHRWHLLVHCDAGVSRSGAVVEAALRAFPGHFIDLGGARHGNNYVRRLILRALGCVPMGAEA